MCSKKGVEGGETDRLGTTSLKRQDKTTATTWEMVCSNANKCLV